MYTHSLYGHFGSFFWVFNSLNGEGTVRTQNNTTEKVQPRYLVIDIVMIPR